ncbi:NADPH-dependent 7-cyano-7-deazaguanine reductase QueF [Desulfuromonas acetoxidans]|uniref:GTP cyclohydrolase I n=1 Tax=Desulfuromonas acetoxidans (strain DSM 684 / 11070) TaxID=281689 RepID=Q1K442_DESA6|nr:NADPH-dependent 7-cyano-7-deazaguanine reductase QueF [Desulfuromonas acetoxidans]EAT17261.1 GTP cyclohydrolase I [Desulfuromonas acetoxidans DSM 684]MBF0645910.1 NADPH-dependent 7-cyano-7-deazaguanine reductase QueF [Desulfuromonas acetoxidans]NVD24149.1 NADPH-dependent 7-cyano-7-deazaguanine reductase QueF [Desulfuromonas acetoxidans]NVE15078.1 NADPH-dependent 7-cyano-7-deazaguanine reductase QueF [Desulfuromonas acetoxidans]
MSDLTEIPLGKTTEYPSQYDAGLLYPVPRHLKRDELGISEPLPFYGEDVWNSYELSWLNRKGKPVVALAVFRFSCQSPNLVESKSFKLYLNSLNQTRFDDQQAVIDCLQRDLSQASGSSVTVELSSLDDQSLWQVQTLPGECLDSVDLDVEHYQLNADLLRDAADSADPVEETLYSHLLKSNCLITSQPDWASVWISYRGGRLERRALLAYLISFRQHNEFHEQCVERIFADLMRYCHPQSLTVYARYTRRGGLDINPWRSTEPGTAPQWRLSRQ